MIVVHYQETGRIGTIIVIVVLVVVLVVVGIIIVVDSSSKTRRTQRQVLDRQVRTVLVSRVDPRNEP